MDYRSYEFVSKNPKTPEYAIHVLNQHIRQWYAERGYPDPENKIDRAKVAARLP